MVSQYQVNKQLPVNNDPKKDHYQGRIQDLKLGGAHLK